MTNTIQFHGAAYSIYELRDEIHLVQAELRAGLPKGERRIAQKQIVDLEAAIAAFPEGGR